MTRFLAVDSGLTNTKAVVFDRTSQGLGQASMQVPHSHPRPGHVERNMHAVWTGSARAIKAALADAGLDGKDIAAVGVTGHGDGLYALDRNGAPALPAISSLDSRAAGLIERWADEGVPNEALQVTGQQPHPAAPAAILAWLKANDAEAYSRIATIMSCKDWLRYCLTGDIATDRTEASTSFTDVETQAYSPAALALYGLDDLADCLPSVRACEAVAGHITAEAAEATGLARGTPVTTGVHDVTAAAIGLGQVRPGPLTVVAGTYSINETIADKPARHPGFACRNSFRPGEWMNMAISPASSANIEWLLQHFFPAELAAARERGGNVFDDLQPEIEAAFEDESRIVFHPFLYGSPLGATASGGFFGLQGWHGRGHILRAVLEGIAFNHRTHVDALKQVFPLTSARVTGGASRNPRLLALFAESFGLPVETVASQEMTALGAMVTAALGTGHYASYDQAAAQIVQQHQRVEPQGAAWLERQYQLYHDLAEAIEPLWGRLRPATA